MPPKYSVELNGIKHSELAPAFEVKKENPYGLKHMIPEDNMGMNPGKTVVMNTQDIKPLSGIKKMEPATRNVKPWKPMGRK